MNLTTNLEVTRLLKRIDLGDLKEYETALNKEMDVIARESMDCEGVSLSKETYATKKDMLASVSNEINYKMNVSKKVTSRVTTR